MELEQRIVVALEAIGADIAAAKARDGELTSLTTTSKNSLVAAVNELKAANDSTGAAALTITNNLSDVGDAATSRSNLQVNSSTETAAAITTAVAGVTLSGLGGATPADVDTAIQSVLGGTPPAELNTIMEIAEELQNDDNAFAALTTQVNNKVSWAAAQALTEAQKLQACQNIGIGNPDADLLASYVTARDA